MKAMRAAAVAATATAMLLILLFPWTSAMAAERIGLIDVVVTGVAPEVQARFENSLEEGLHGAGFEVVPRSEVLDELVKRDAPEGCSFGPCLSAVGEKIGVRVVLVARISAEGPSYAFVLTLVDTHTGTPISQLADNCPVCTLNEALASSTLSVVSLATRTGPATSVAGVGWVSLASKERGCPNTVARWTASFGVAAVILGGILLTMDHDVAAASSLGAGGGLGIAGLSLFLLSRN
ncbi:MAG: hypothetical protein V2A73_18035 [Pseudomonadota bacterium]